MRLGDVARAVGMRPDALRAVRHNGLLPWQEPASDGSHRQYSDCHVAALLLLRSFQDLGVPAARAAPLIRRDPDLARALRDELASLHDRIQ